MQIVLEHCYAFSGLFDRSGFSNHAYGTAHIIEDSEHYPGGAVFDGKTSRLFVKPS